MPLTGVDNPLVRVVNLPKILTRRQSGDPHLTFEFVRRFSGGKINSKLVHMFHSHALRMASDAAALKEKKV